MPRLLELLVGLAAWALILWVAAMVYPVAKVLLRG